MESNTTPRINNPREIIWAKQERFSATIQFGDNYTVSIKELGMFVDDNRTPNHPTIITPGPGVRLWVVFYWDPSGEDLTFRVLFKSRDKAAKYAAQMAHYRTRGY